MGCKNPFKTLGIMKNIDKVDRIVKFVCVGFIAFCGAMVLIDMLING
jgi:hypothetical protein